MQGKGASRNASKPVANYNLTNNPIIIIVVGWIGSPAYGEELEK